MDDHDAVLAETHAVHHLVVVLKVAIGVLDDDLAGRGELRVLSGVACDTYAQPVGGIASLLKFFGDVVE